MVYLFVKIVMLFLIKYLKLLLIVAKKSFINRRSNIPHCKNCKKFVYV